MVPPAEGILHFQFLRDARKVLPAAAMIRLRLSEVWSEKNRFKKVLGPFFIYIGNSPAQTCHGRQHFGFFGNHVVKIDRLRAELHWHF